MTKNELNTLVRKIQNECGLESPTKITYYWNEERKLVFKLFFESLAVPEDLKIDEENIQNMFTVNDTYLYEDDFLIKDYNTTHGFIEVIPNDQNFKIVNSYKELATEKETNTQEESIVRLAGKRLNEKVAREYGFILQESETPESEGEEATTKTENKENENSAALNSTATAYMCGEVTFVGKEEKDKLIQIFKEWIAFDNSDVKDLVKKVILKDELNSEEYSIVKAISETNVGSIVASISNESESESTKYCVYEDDEEYVTELVKAADKENSVVLLAPNTAEPPVLNEIQKKSDLNDALTSAWQNLQASAKNNFELVDRLTTEIASEFTSEKVFGSSGDLHTPFTAAFIEAQSGEKAKGEKEDFDGATWKEYEAKVPEIKNALEEMKNLTVDQSMAIRWVMQQAANMQVATIDEETRALIKQENQGFLSKLQDFFHQKGQDLKTFLSNSIANPSAWVAGAKTALAGTLDAAEITNSEVKATTDTDMGGAFGITGEVSHTSSNEPAKRTDKEPKEDTKNTFAKQNYFEEMLKVYCLLNREKFNQVVDKISIGE